MAFVVYMALCIIAGGVACIAAMEVANYVEHVRRKMPAGKKPGEYEVESWEDE